MTRPQADARRVPGLARDRGTALGRAVFSRGGVLVSRSSLSRFAVLAFVGLVLALLLLFAWTLAVYPARDCPLFVFIGEEHCSSREVAAIMLWTLIKLSIWFACGYICLRLVAWWTRWARVGYKVLRRRLRG